MYNKKKTIYFGLVLFITTLMCLQAAAISTVLTNNQRQTPIEPTLVSDVLVSSDNPDGDDSNPRIARNSQATLAVTYEKETSIFSKTAMIQYSSDRGDSWQAAYEIDSAELFDLSGVLYNPDLIFNSNNNLFYFVAVDPLAEMYNNIMAFIPADLGGDASLYAISGSDSSGYLEAAAGCTDNYFLALTTEDGYGYEQLFGLGYFTYPDFEHPPVMGGFYYDGNSEWHSAPASHLEMEVGNRVCIVFDQLETGSVDIKSTVADEVLLTGGEQQNGMDKYADIEQYPGSMVAADAHDPDVACSGDMVYVAYASNDGNVYLKYSSASPEYDPEFDWQTTLIGPGTVPAVYAVGQKVVVAYVNNYNLFLATSTDGGATFEIGDQINDVTSTVSQESGSVDLTDLAVVWVDTRSGTKDIYSEALPAAIIELGDLTGGFGVTGVVKNTGTLDAENIQVSLTIDCNLLFVGGDVTETITIGAGDEETISSGLILGLGGATITLRAGTEVKQMEATILGPFVL